MLVSGRVNVGKYTSHMDGMGQEFDPVKISRCEMDLKIKVPELISWEPKGPPQCHPPPKK